MSFLWLFHLFRKSYWAFKISQIGKKLPNRVTLTAIFYSAKGIIYDENMFTVQATGFLLMGKLLIAVIFVCRNQNGVRLQGYNGVQRFLPSRFSSLHIESTLREPW